MLVPKKITTYFFSKELKNFTVWKFNDVKYFAPCFRYNRLASGSVPKSLSNCVQLEEFNIENNAVRNVKTSLANESLRMEILHWDWRTLYISLCYARFQVCALPEGLLAALDSLIHITISRNAFTAFPTGGPAQVNFWLSYRYDNLL